MSLLVPVFVRPPAPLTPPLKMNVAVPLPWNVVPASSVTGALTL